MKLKTLGRFKKLHSAARSMCLIATTVMFFTASHFGQAQDIDIQTVYATEKGACGRRPETRIEITKGRITGPGFDCALAKSRPAGTGLIAYPGTTCTVDGKKTIAVLALDLGNFQDHFKLMLPGRDNWLSLYPCTPVPGLNWVQ